MEGFRREIGLLVRAIRLLVGAGELDVVLVLLVAGFVLLLSLMETLELHFVCGRVNLQLRRLILHMNKI